MLQAEIEKAIENGEFARAAALFAQLPRPASIQEAAHIKESLERSLRIVRIQRAHDAARLNRLIRTSAYRHPTPEPQSTWSLDA